MTAEIENSSTFEDCVSNKVSYIADKEPDVKPDQRVAMAYSFCRKKFGISKASILFLLERSQLLNDESLEQVKATMEKGMESTDWVEFAGLMKNQGSKHQEICNRVNKSESWIKKYVNPILEGVTPPINLIKSLDTIEALEPGLPVLTILEFTVTEIKKENRTFGGWGSVEVLDSQTEVVSIDGLEAIMPTYMKRGAPIMFGHSNRHVGNVFKYQIKDKLVKGEYIPALWLEGRIFSDYKIDDLAWEAIQYAYTAGLPVLSLGATPIGHPEVKCDDSACFKKYNEFQLYEFTVTEQQKGSIGANPEATIEVALAKSKEGKELNTKKEKEISEQLAKLEKSSTLPENDIDLVNMMLATCKSCQDEYKKMIESGSTEEQAKASLLKELVETMNKTIDAPTNPDAQKDDSNAAIKKSAPASTFLKEMPDLAAALTQINDRLDKIEQSVTKATADIGATNASYVEGSTIKADDKPAKEEEEEEEEKQPPFKKADDSKEPAQVTFSKDFEKHMDTYLQKKGLVKIAETPIPTTTEGREITEIQKGDPNHPGNQSKMPSSEEMSDAMAGWKNGDISKLAAKYGY